MRLNHLFSVVSTILVVLIAGPVGPAAAQQQEKRIALVIGNGAYAKAPLSTAANDGGLIAQTLQAAGFDVSGARDLDGDTLRGAFRDFVKKAEDSGPDTVAAVYLAGYGVQYAGENYFIPVDTRLSRDTEIPTEGLRISDYLRQLAALPLKTSVVVLDLAREQPFVPGGSIASGLAMVEPNPKMLIAFNAAPGTVAPEERGAYGVYAQALAEMIRTGGLTLPQLFDRVRLRVNESTKGAQVPWDTQSVESNFMFFDRAPDAPPLPAPDQTLRSKPIRDMGAAEAYAAALDRDTLQAYEDFLAAYPNDPLAKRVRAIVAARREAITWRRTYRVDTPDAYWSYIRRYPRGPHAADARRRLEILAAALEPPPSFTVIDYDVPPPPPDEIVYVDRPVLMFSDPVFDFAPPPPPPVFFLPPPPPDFVVLPPPPPPIGLFYLPRPMFVPIPAYVRPPVYVQPPPNNIIFANIHNTTVINQVINQPPAAANPAAPVVSPPVAGPAVATPGAPAPAVTAAAVASGAVLGAALPAAALHRATLIQQGKAPVPQSASIATTPPGGFAQRPGVQLQGPRLAQPAATPTQAPTTTAPVSAPTPAPGSSPSQPTGPAVAAPAGQGRPAPTAPAGAAPAVQALPVPGTKGLPPAPGVAARPGIPSVAQPQPPGRPALGPGGPAAARNGAIAPPAGSAPRPLAGTPPAGAGPAVRPEAVRPQQQVPAARLRPTPPVTAPARPAGPPPGAAADRRPPPAAPRIQRPAPPTVSRPVPPPMHVAPRVAPPPPQHAAPRMAPPPAPVRAAPPPPHVAPPRPPAPPRTAPPPRPQGPAKRCPPGVKEC
ncbi:caspase family protein [Rhodopseudomonas palustris]|uniref:caspase family protein n=1 Tax=Rhodopseudomonas palustris TaxID=1076 RepID=UPI000D1BD256|nr:caspase domain-containing protein [Rhodopseudomonas palustris]AVT81827.1 peptidase C14, caspase catalytic subunit p20 precursor [Rhodopseudomonas palustris]